MWLDEEQNRLEIHTLSAHNYDTDKPITGEHDSNSAVLQHSCWRLEPQPVRLHISYSALVTGHLDGDTINTV